MEYNKLNKLIREYIWLYEWYDGDKGFVIAKDREEAIEKLSVKYSHVKEMLQKMDEGMDNEWAYVYSADYIDIDGDIFVTVPR